MKDKIKLIIDIITPRFITEKVALELSDDGFEITCSASDLCEFDRPDAFCVVRTFNFFGEGYFPKIVSGTFEAVSDRAKIEIKDNPPR